MAKKNKNIIRYRKPININIGVIIFAFLFVYLLVIGYMYITKEKVQVYQVAEGSLATNSRYTGLILREESTTASPYSGYVHYYIREGERAAVNSLVYSIDESGTAADLFTQNAEDANNLSDEHLASLRARLSQFSAGYDGMAFHEIYDVKYSLQSSLLEYVNQSTLEEIKESLESLGSYFQLEYADESGVVVYSTDGYEGKQHTEITAEDFDTKHYKRNYVLGGSVVESGTTIYKTITDPVWEILFQITEEDALAFANKTSVTIRFLQNGIETSGAFSTFVGADQNIYGRLELKDYMIQYYDSRYVDFELFPERESGLKIPVSSVVYKDFYIIPTEFLTTGGGTNETGFLREVYQQGGSSVLFESPTIYYQDEEYCYVDPKAYAAGDNLVKPDSAEQYKIGPTKSLIGVFNINKGYAIFRQVEILDQNEEYYIVKKGTSYGLSVYDHIVLDGNTIAEDDIIY